MNETTIQQAISQIDTTISNLQAEITRLETTRRLLESQLPKPREDLFRKAQRQVNGHELPGWTEQD
jgi:hypothetical protein